MWIADVETPVHFFVFTLGFSRRAVAYAYRNERLDTLLVAFARARRGGGEEDESLLRALAADLVLGADPLMLDLAELLEAPE